MGREQDARYSGVVMYSRSMADRSRSWTVSTRRTPMRRGVEDGIVGLGLGIGL